MSSSRETEFGLLISFLLPGFIGLVGLSYHSNLVYSWMGNSPTESPTLGGFMILTVLATFVGLITSTIRWATIDVVHHRTGIRPPAWRFEQLGNRQQGFLLLIEIHYRFYLFHSNSIIAIIWLWLAKAVADGFRWLDFLATIAIVTLLFAGSRDTLSKYYRRGEQLLQSDKNLS